MSDDNLDYYARRALQQTQGHSQQVTNTQQEGAYVPGPIETIDYEEREASTSVLWNAMEEEQQGSAASATDPTAVTAMQPPPKPKKGKGSTRSRPSSVPGSQRSASGSSASTLQGGQAALRALAPAPQGGEPAYGSQGDQPASGASASGSQGGKSASGSSASKPKGKSSKSTTKPHYKPIHGRPESAARGPRARKTLTNEAFVVRWTDDGCITNSATGATVPIPQARKEFPESDDPEAEYEQYGLLDSITINLLREGIRTPVYDEGMSDNLKEIFAKSLLSVAADRTLRAIEQTFRGSGTSLNNYSPAVPQREASRLIMEDVTSQRHLLGNMYVDPTKVNRW